MASVVRVYRSTDASAPTLAGSVGSLGALLRACLVDGYGSQPAAGWTMPFSPASNRYAFRNDTTDGKGLYFVFYSDGTFNQQWKTDVVCYVSMTDITTGSGSINGWSPGTSPAGLIHGTADNVPSSQPWMVIADNRTCYVFSQPTGSGESSFLAFGEMQRIVPTDTNYGFILSGGGGGSSFRSNATFGNELFAFRRPMYNGQPTTIVFGTQGKAFDGPFPSGDSIRQGVGAYYFGHPNTDGSNDFYYPGHTTTTVYKFTGPPNTLMMYRPCQLQEFGVSFGNNSFTPVRFWPGMYDVVNAAPYDFSGIFNEQYMEWLGSGQFAGRRWRIVLIAGGAWIAIETTGSWTYG